MDVWCGARFGEKSVRIVDVRCKRGNTSFHCCATTRNNYRWPVDRQHSKLTGRFILFWHFSCAFQNSSIDWCNDLEVLGYHIACFVPRKRAKHFILNDAPPDVAGCCRIWLLSNHVDPYISVSVVMHQFSNHTWTPFWSSCHHHTVFLDARWSQI